MKTILLLHDEATTADAAVAKRAACQGPSPRDRSCRRLQLRPLGSSVSRLCRAQLLNRHRSFRFQCPRRNEVKHGIPDCI